MISRKRGRHTLFHLLLAGLYLVCSARSCDNGAGEEERAAAARDSIARLTAPAPGPATVEGFSATARSRLADYASYRSIARDSAVDTLFRRKAAEMADRMVAPGLSAPDLPVIPDSVWITRPPAPGPDSAYSGELAWSSHTGLTGVAAFRIGRTAKVFGRDTLRVWEVYLYSGR